MILARAPLRVSLFGGSSDIPAFYMKDPGATVSMAIDKYVYVAVMETPYRHVKASYSEQEVVANVDDLQNELIREGLKHFGYETGIEVTTFADIPTIGTGLAGSSAFACALSVALRTLRDMPVLSRDIAEDACTIEIDRCRWNIGKQDQYASASGGYNYFRYFPDHVTRYHLKGDISQNCILIPTNIERHASNIIDSIDFESKRASITEIRDLAVAMAWSKTNPETIGKFLNYAWEEKKKTSAFISNPEIDRMYDSILASGAYGAKLLGAGGGGYMLAVCPDSTYVSKLESLFDDRVCLRFNLDTEGAKVVYHG